MAFIKSGHVTEGAGWLTDRRLQANQQHYGRAEGKVMKQGLGDGGGDQERKGTEECLPRRCSEVLQSLVELFLQAAEKCIV